MIDEKKRSFLKAFVWRTLAAIILGVITYGITEDAVQASYITFLYHGIQIMVYFLHERVWNYISWGKSRGIFIQMTGLSGSGKTTIAKKVQKSLIRKGYKVEVIDGDEYREGLCSDLGFSKEDRNTNIRRLGFVGKVLSRNDVITIMSAINPYEKVRKEVRQMGENVKTVFVDCELEKLKSRDPKGLYARAMLPDGNPEKISNFTGISDPFDSPLVCDLRIDTTKEIEEDSAKKLENFIMESI
jgi:adenylylsulfate kinase